MSFSQPNVVNVEKPNNSQSPIYPMSNELPRNQQHAKKDGSYQVLTIVEFLGGLIGRYQLRVANDTWFWDGVPRINWLASSTYQSWHWKSLSSSNGEKMEKDMMITKL